MHPATHEYAAEKTVEQLNNITRKPRINEAPPITLLGASTSRWSRLRARLRRNRPTVTPANPQPQA